MSKQPIFQIDNASVEPLNGCCSPKQLNFMPNLTIEAGRVLGQITDTGVSEIQTINFSETTDTPSGGTFALSIPGIDGGTFTTAALVYNISNANLKIAIEALFVAAGYEGITVTIGAGPCPDDTTVTFGGSAASFDIPLLVADGTLLTGGTPTVAITTTTAPVGVGLWGKYDDNASDGREVAKSISRWAFRTDNAGRVIFGSADAHPIAGDYHLTAEAWFDGEFKTTDLIGLDANGAADLGRIIMGTVTDGVLKLR